MNYKLSINNGTRNYWYDLYGQVNVRQWETEYSTWIMKSLHLLMDMCFIINKAWESKLKRTW